MIENERRVLIIDDCPEDRETYRRYLLQDPDYIYIVLEEESGEKGLELCKQIKPDSVLLDYRLPDLDGLEFLDELRDKAGKVDIPVVMVTGYGNEAVAVQAMKNGASDYLVKGHTTPESLRLALRHAMEKAELLEQLENSQEQLKFQAYVLSQINEAVLITEAKLIDEPGPRILYANEAFTRMTGYSVEEVLGKTPRILQGPKTDRAMLAQIRAALTTSQPVMVEMLNYRKDGSDFWAEINIVPMANETGECTHFIAVQRDISERKQIEEELAQLLEREQAARIDAETANRTKDDFLATVSHELKSPLNSILAWTQLLQNRKFDQVTTARALETIQRNVKLQSQLIDDLFDISRIIRGQLRLNLEPIYLLPTIQAAIDTLLPLAYAKSIKIEPALDFSAAKVLADSSRLQQVIWNLLSNAIKFTPQGGCITIRLERVDSYAQIQVIDTGQGISADFLPYVFDQFRQANSISHNGLGLGLAIVRRLVELHNGTVQAASEGEGQGATFTVRLPLQNDEPESMNIGQN